MRNVSVITTTAWKVQWSLMSLKEESKENFRRIREEEEEEGEGGGFMRLVASAGRVWM